MLQIVTDMKKIVEECKLFMPYDEVYPEDWDFWLSEKDGYIGLDIFQTKDQTQYFRVWENDDAKRVVEQDQKGNQITRIPPVQLTEKLYLDPYGEETEMVKYELTMLYGRHVNDKVDEIPCCCPLSMKRMEHRFRSWLGSNCNTSLSK